MPRKLGAPVLAAVKGKKGMKVRGRSSHCPLGDWAGGGLNLRTERKKNRRGLTRESNKGSPFRKAAKKEREEKGEREEGVGGGKRVVM